MAPEHQEFHATPEAAIACLRAHDGPLYVDLDGTLYLRNSTEDFIDTARPGLLAAMLLNVLDAVKPWRWTGGIATRDPWRVWMIRTLFPWTRLRWRRRAPALAGQFANQQLLAALRGRDPGAVIVTAGFRPIVEPLAEALGFTKDRVVAVRLGFEDRVRGKLDMAVAALGEEAIASSLFITDSPDDLAMLTRCGRPLLTCWPDARHRQAFEHIYMPGQYIARVKRPGKRYIWTSVIQEDLAIWVLSSVALTASPLRCIPGLALLLASFWTIYERGYVDNDWAAVHLESDGKLSASFHCSEVATPALQPWLWASVAAAAAAYLLAAPGAIPVAFAKWMVVLSATYWVFKLYNRIDKAGRPWLYVLLQLARGAAFAVIVPMTLVGAMAVASVVIRRWMSYYVYRLRSGDWPELDANIIQLTIFLVLTVLLGISLGFSAVLGWTCALLFAWSVYRARRELLQLLRRVRRLSARHTPASAPLSDPP